MENRYRIRKATQSLPLIDLLPPIPHRGKKLDVAIFGPGMYGNNLKAMSKYYCHSKEKPKISFRPATISESISISKFGFGNKGRYDAKRDIFNSSWLQANYFVGTQEGVFTNTRLIDENQLKQLLNKCEKVNGIYLGENDLGFVPYETFETGFQDSDTFTRGGLARGFEHTRAKIAENLRVITSPKLYKRGVGVYVSKGEGPELISGLVTLGSGRGPYRDTIYVDGYGGGYEEYGFAFGVVPAKSE
jgi:hypothetical protein